MANTEEKRALPLWVGAVAIAIVLIGIVFYGVHVLRPQAPNSDFKEVTSFHKGASPSASPPTAPANR